MTKQRTLHLHAQNVELLDQLVLALGVYADIKEYEAENGRLPDFCAESFKLWREWRVVNKLEGNVPPEEMYFCENCAYNYSCPTCKMEGRGNHEDKSNNHR